MCCACRAAEVVPVKMLSMSNSPSSLEALPCIAVYHRRTASSTSGRVTVSDSWGQTASWEEG
eukprot:363888-Chlamydomonas_euryale.AAC.18